MQLTESQNDRLRNFAHIVSHNLRSHSSGITLLIQFLEKSNPELVHDEVFSHLINASKNLENTIKDLNQVIEVNLIGEKNFQKILLKPIIDSVLESLHGQINDSGIEIIVDIEEQIYVLGLKAYVESIILNFTTNAIKYRSSEAAYLKISANTSPDKINVVLLFEDNGLGMDLKLYKDKIFKMYKTFHSHPDSRGLGLFLTKNQIEAMNGTVDVVSAINKGTTFKIFLPYEKN